MRPANPAIVTCECQCERDATASVRARGRHSFLRPIIRRPPRARAFRGGAPILHDEVRIASRTRNRFLFLWMRRSQRSRRGVGSTEVPVSHGQPSRCRGRVALVAPTARQCGIDVTRARWCRISGGQMIRGRDAAIAPKHRVAFITGLNRHRASPPCHVHVRTVVQHRRRSAGPAEHFVRFPNVCGRLASVLCSGSLQLLTRPLRHGDNFAHAITRVPNNRITRLH